MSRGRFESDSKSEVFVRIAVLEIPAILRSMSTVRFFTENADQRLFNEAEIQRRMLLEISEIFLLFQLFSGTPLSEFRKLIFFVST